MATKIVTKSGSGAPATTDLVAGELAVDLTNKRLYTENGSAAIIELGTNPSGDVTFGDNGKAIFGAGSDLQIYHDGSNSYVGDYGTGNLSVTGENLYLQNTAGETYFSGISDGVVSLYHDNAVKLATSASGIDVTGTVALVNGANEWQLYTNVSNDDLEINYNGAGNAEVVVDTAGNVGIGTTSPQSIVHIDQGASDAQLTLETHAAGDSKIVFSQGQTAGNWAVGYDDGGGVTDNSLSFAYKADGYPSLSGQSKMILTPAGDVGIGTSSPNYPLTIGDGTDALETVNIVSTDAGSSRIFFSDASGVGQGRLTYDHSDSSLQIYTADTEAMRIDASGNLLVGTTDTAPYDNSANSTADNGIVAGAGLFAAARYQGSVGLFNRTGNDGEILGFKRSGAAVGAIGTHLQDGQTNFFIGLDNASSDVGLGFGAAAGTGRAYYPARVDGSGVSDVISIGTSTYKYKDLHLSGTANVAGVTSSGQIKVTASNATTVALSVGDTGTGFYNAGTNVLGISTSGSEAARFSGGNLLVGKTTTTDARIGTGHIIRGDDSVLFSRDASGETMQICRNADAGDLVRLYSNAVQVGSIGTGAGVLGIGHGTGNLGFLNANVIPMGNTSGSASDGVIDLGNSNRRFKDLHLSGNISTGIGAANANNYQIKVSAGTTGLSRFIAADTSDVGYIDYEHSSDSWIHRTGGVERMRLDSTGSFYVGTTTTGSNVATGFTIQNPSAATYIALGHANGTSSGLAYTIFSYNSGTIGSITQSGTTAVLYNTSSDQRLKENIADADDAGSKIDSIQVRKFDWKADGSHQDYGMVAQELIEVAPEAVSAPEDSDEMMGVDYSKLVPMMLKEIQSLRARIAQLES